MKHSSVPHNLRECWALAFGLVPAPLMDTLHRSLDLRAMRFEEYVRGGNLQGFHSTLGPDEWQMYHKGQASRAARGSFGSLIGAANGGGLWAVEQIRSWQQAAGLRPLPPVPLCLLPCCKMQMARKLDL